MIVGVLRFIVVSSGLIRCEIVGLLIYLSFRLESVMLSCVVER